MANTYAKVDDYNIERTKQEEKPAAVKTTFNREFLESQKKAIQASKDAYDAQRDVELEEVNEMLVECDKLGIKATEPTEVVNGN